MRAQCTVGPERLITTEGTIIPQAVRFANGNMLLTYSVGADAYFAGSGAHRSRDNGTTWERCDCPWYRPCAKGAVADDRALLFDQYLWRTGEHEFQACYVETRDSGESFSEPRLARFHIENVVCHDYVPRPQDDPDRFVEPEVPDLYRPITEKHGTVIGAYTFGTVLRLPDGALGMSCHATMEGSMARQRQQGNYVGARPDEANAPEATQVILESSLFLRSEDEGRSWRHTSTIGTPRPDRPFDSGKIYSEGFNETGMACTSDGKIFTLMRHGSYMLLWWATSDDCGRTWSEIEPLNYPGVAPCVTRMPSGALAAAWGRPGMTVAFSLDGSGQNWDLLTSVMDDRHHSQKYPWIVPVDHDRLMLFYDRRKWDCEKRKHYDHGIYCREIGIVTTSAVSH